MFLKDFGMVISYKIISPDKIVYITANVDKVIIKGIFKNNEPVEGIVKYKNNKLDSMHMWVGFFRKGWFVRGTKKNKNSHIIKEKGEFKKGKLSRGIKVYDTLKNIKETGKYDTNGFLKLGVRKVGHFVVEEGAFENNSLSLGKKTYIILGDYIEEIGYFEQNHLISKDIGYTFSFKPVWYFSIKEYVLVEFFRSQKPLTTICDNYIKTLTQKNLFYKGMVYDKKAQQLLSGKFNSDFKLIKGLISK